ncbi:MAG: ABC transporter permease [Streptosporangiaceae bacterium]
MRAAGCPDAWLLMLAFIIRRIFHAVVVLIGVTLVTFVLQHVIASGTTLARAMLGPRANPLSIRAFIQEYGLNKPLPVQYWNFLWQLLHGNLGYSYKLNQSVDSILARDLPNDLLLVGTALVLAVLIAVPLGIAQAGRRGKFFDQAATGVSFLLYAMPSFWLGLLLIQFLAVNSSIFPAQGPQSDSIGNLQALVLPIATMTLVSYALFSRYMRSSAIDTLASDYIRTARAKGASQLRVFTRHTLRNSFAAMVTLIGLSLPAVLTWGVTVEYVFNYPGTGLTFYNAAATDDYPLELGIIVLVGVATVVGSLLADIAYAVLDPRIRYD